MYLNVLSIHFKDLKSNFDVFFFFTEKDITNNEPLENTTELPPVPDENMTDLEEIER